jgi:ribosomal protein L28
VKSSVNGVNKRIRVCTTCIKGGKVVKAPVRVAHKAVAAKA